MDHQYVLDTNFFINRQRPINLGNSKEEVINNFIDLVLPLVKKNQIVFLTTPESYKELASFFKENPEALNKLTKVITISSYSRNSLQINSVLFEELIAETGKRLYRGLRVAEEFVKNLSSAPLSTEAVGLRVTQLREKYRRATREGFIDSTIDLGLIFLAKEKEAILVSSDNGLLTWARNFGCQELLPELLVQKIKALA